MILDNRNAFAEHNYMVKMRNLTTSFVIRLLGAATPKQKHEWLAVPVLSER